MKKWYVNLYNGSSYIVEALNILEAIKSVSKDRGVKPVEVSRVIDAATE